MEEEYSYDTWGRRRIAQDWTYTLDGRTPITDRGYCMHEHLDNFALINMNGRMYDPAVGQFLSPDPFVQAPQNTQNYNRYSYCLNNPLKYIDPSGYDYYIDGLWVGGMSDSYLSNPKNWAYIASLNGVGVNGAYSYDFTKLDGNLHYNKYRGSYGFWLDRKLAKTGKANYYNVNGNVYGISSTYNVSSRWIYMDAFVNNIKESVKGNTMNAASGGEGWTDAAGHINDAIGGFGTAAGKLSGTFRLTDGTYNGSNLSLKYYSSGWTGGSRAAITTYSAAEWGSRIGKGSIVVSVGLGAYNIYNGYQQDGCTYGLNAQVATGQTIGGIGGGMAGAEIGAAIGVWFGGVGAIPGAIIGGVIGGWLGTEAGGATVLQIRK